MIKKEVRFKLPDDSPVSPRDRSKRRQRLDPNEVKQELDKFKELTIDTSVPDTDPFIMTPRHGK